MYKKQEISEVDLMVYYLAVDRKYYELLELYGLFYEHSVCTHCGHETGIHFKLIKEIINSFGGIRRGIKIPTMKELSQISRDITIWKGLKDIVNDNDIASRVAEYAKRFELTNDMVYKIKVRVANIVKKFRQMKKVFRKFRHGTNSK